MARQGVGESSRDNVAQHDLGPHNDADRGRAAGAGAGQVRANMGLGEAEFSVLGYHHSGEHFASIDARDLKAAKPRLHTLASKLWL